jgi:hypothetical protein
VLWTYFLLNFNSHNSFQISVQFILSILWFLSLATTLASLGRYLITYVVFYDNSIDTLPLIFSHIVLLLLILLFEKRLLFLSRIIFKQFLRIGLLILLDCVRLLLFSAIVFWLVMVGLRTDSSLPIWRFANVYFSYKRKFIDRLKLGDWANLKLILVRLSLKNRIQRFVNWVLFGVHSSEPEIFIVKFPGL